MRRIDRWRIVGSWALPRRRSASPRRHSRDILHPTTARESALSSFTFLSLRILNLLRAPDSLGLAMVDDGIPDPRPLQRRLTRGPARKEIRLSLATITPILGGSPVLRQVDDVDVIRVPSIRGQLRFWWRALYGYQWRDPAELAKHEGALWGTAGGDEGGRSQVDVVVSDVKRSGPPDDSAVKLGSPEGYVLWPARGERRGTPPAPRWQPGIAFQLIVHAPAPREVEVIHALRAWILFGGYGSRTRRGLGSLRVIGEAQHEWMPARVSRDEWRRLFGQLPVFDRRSDEERSDMPSLFGATLCYDDHPATESLKAWTTAIAWLQDFRQGRPPGPERTPSGRYARSYGGPAYDREGRRKYRPGPSNWSEPDKIRWLSGQNEHWSHVPRREHRGGPAWPRAGFGLPIQGQFQREDRHGGTYHEPDDFAFHWQDASGALHERLASPLILKAMPLQGDRYVPIALWLFRGYPKEGRVVLKQIVPTRRAGQGGQGHPKHARVAMRQREQSARGFEAPFDRLRADGDGEPRFRPLRGKSSLREAFVAWLKQEKRAREFG